MPPKTLYETTMDRKTRRLLRVEIPEDAHIATEEVISQLMGSDPSARAAMVQDGALYIDDIDV